MNEVLPDVLSRIVAQKQADLALLRDGYAEAERAAETAAETKRDFRGALLSREPAVIAEIKKASPSKGLLADRFDPAALARAYEEGGAAAISVLTDVKFFQGSLADLKDARESVALPVLRKDFTIDEYHVVEAAASGADAVLLIAAVLGREELARFRELAAGYRMAALVEVHDERELEIALDSGAEIIGVNNRNLHTFDVSLETSLRLAARIPAGLIRVSESGIHSSDDVRTLASAGYQAFLVGEHLMRSGNPTEALRALLP